MKFREYIIEKVTSKQLKKEQEQSVLYSVKTKKMLGKIYPSSKKAKEALDKLDDADLKVASYLFFIDNIKNS